MENISIIVKKLPKTCYSCIYRQYKTEIDLDDFNVCKHCCDYCIAFGINNPIIIHDNGSDTLPKWCPLIEESKYDLYVKYKDEDPDFSGLDD